MTTLLNIKENMRKLYSEHSVIIKPILKFIFTLIALLIMNHYVGFNTTLNNPAVLVLISALSSVLATGIVVVIYTVIVLVNMYSISPEIALVVLLVFLVMYFLFFRFSSEHGFIVLAMPVLFFLKMPFLMPILIGIAWEPVAIVGMIFGTIIFYMLQYGGNEAVLIANGLGGSGIEKIGAFISDLVQNKEMIVLIVAFAIAALITYGIKRLSIDNAPMIAIISGGSIEAMLVLFSMYLLEVQGNFKLWMIIVFTILSILISMIVNVFILAVDYSGTEYVQFEDDDYYYYVKAVPKLKVAKRDVKVKHINVKKSGTK